MWYDQNEMGHDLVASMKSGIANSKVVLICLNSLYQSRENCLFELREAYNTNKSTLTLLIEENKQSWVSPEVREKLNLESSIDFGELSNMDWDREDGPTEEMKIKLTRCKSLQNH